MHARVRTYVQFCGLRFKTKLGCSVSGAGWRSVLQVCGQFRLAGTAGCSAAEPVEGDPAGPSPLTDVLGQILGNELHSWGGVNHVALG